VVSRPLTHRAALSILGVVATPSQGRKITRSRIITMLHRRGRRNDPSLVEQIFTVTNPNPKVGMAREFFRAVRLNEVRLRHLARDGWQALRAFR